MHDAFLPSILVGTALESIPSILSFLLFFFQQLRRQVWQFFMKCRLVHRNEDADAVFETKCWHPLHIDDVVLVATTAQYKILYVNMCIFRESVRTFLTPRSCPLSNTSFFPPSNRRPHLSSIRLHIPSLLSCTFIPCLIPFQCTFLLRNRPPGYVQGQRSTKS